MDRRSSLCGAPLLLLIGPFAVIAVLVVALAALAALVALAGAGLALPYLLVRPLRRDLADQRHAMERTRRLRQLIDSKDLTMNPSQREAVDQLIARVLLR